MKIISISLDNSILNKHSSLAKRTVEYGNLVEKYTVIAPSKEDQEVDLSEKVKVFGVGSANKTITLFRVYKIAKKLLAREGYNIITVQDQYYFALIGWLLAKKFLPAGRQGKIGLEIQIHGFEKYGGLRKMIAKFVIPKASAVRTVSQRLKKRLMSEFKVKEEKITAVPVHVDIGNYELGIRNYDVHDKFIFLTVGRLVPVKNIEMQIRAMASIVKKSKVKSQKLELWVVGDGSEMGNLKFEIARLDSARQRNLGLEKNVKLFGWQNDLEEFYKKADAFLLTSYSEGWPLVIVEAASFSLPIIMTNMGSAGELIKDGENGMVIPLNDQEKLEERMIKLVEDGELRKKLGENARQAVLNLPTKEEILNLYKKSWQIAKRNNI